MKFFKKKDIIIIIVLLVLSIIGIFAYRHINRNKAAIAEIYYGSDIIKTIDLSKGQEITFKVPQNPHVVIKTSKDGYIWFDESDCPDQICVHTGKIHLPGQSAACLPNKVIVVIVSKDEYDKNSVDIAGR